MVLIYLLLIIFFLIDTKPLLVTNSDYLSIKENTPIKGLLVILVYFSHFVQYISDEQKTDMLTRYFIMIVGFMGQLIVTMFFVYSGYGLFYKIKEKKDEYISSFLIKRFLPVYLDFVVCVFLFLIMNISMKQAYPIKTIVLSFIGWESIGNSNWFMFDTFVSYFLFYLSFKFIKNSKTALYIYTILTCVFIAILFCFKENYWWNTILCLPLGMWICYKKDLFDKICKNLKCWILSLIIGFAIFLGVYILQRSLDFFYIATAVCFSIIVVFIQMKIDISRSKIFSFLGKHVFSIYMLQRLFLILLDKTYVIKYPIVYCFLGFLFTVIFSYIFDLVLSKIKNKLLDEKRVIYGK